MRKQLKKKHDELYEIIEKQDEELLKLIKLGHRSLIIQVIKDYLSWCE